MRSLFKITTGIAIILTVFYSCQKSQVTANTSSSLNSLGTQIARSLYQSLSGKYGGENISQGAKVNALSGRNSKAINGIYDLCGVTIDTTSFNTNTVVDTTYANAGHFKFTYICNSGGVDGYIIADTLTSTANSPGLQIVTKGYQSYTVTALDLTFLLVSMDGSLGTQFHNATLSGSTVTASHDITTNYILNGVKVDASSGVADLITGTASYQATVTDVNTQNPSGTSSGYHGLITFLGNHQATLTVQINSTGVTYTFAVNLLTGAIVQQ